MTEKPTPRAEQPLASAETRTEFASSVGAEGDAARGHVVGSVTEKKVFQEPVEADDDMPLPTDPQTIFLGGLFMLAMMTAVYFTAEILLPVILAIVLKLLLQPFVRLLEA